MFCNVRREAADAPKSETINILNREFAAFDQFFHEIIHTKTNFEFFQVIAHSIMPLIREADAYSSLYHAWITQRQKYKKTYLQIESDAKNELYGTLIQLKKILEKENLLQNQSLHCGLSAAEQILDSQKIYIVPSYVKAAYRQLRTLLFELLRQNHTEIVGHFAQITFLDKVVIDETTKEITYIKSPAIEYFTFAPSLTQLNHLHSQFSWDRVDETWIAWEYLTLAEECWNTDPASITVPSIEDNENDAFHLNFRAFCSEMQIIKSGEDSQSLFFQRERFICYLKKIHHELILYQEMHPKEEIEPFPYVISLELQFNRLILNVKWVKESETESYLVHKFNEESEPYLFIKRLLNSQPNTSVFLKSSGANIPKFLERIKLNGILSRLFFTHRTTISLALQSKCIKLREYPDFNLKELRKEIKSFEKVSVPAAISWVNTQV